MTYMYRMLGGVRGNARDFVHTYNQLQLLMGEGYFCREWVGKGWKGIDEGGNGGYLNGEWVQNDVEVIRGENMIGEGFCDWYSVERRL